MASEKHRYSAHGDAIVRGGQGSIAFAHDAKDAAEIAGELNDLLDRVAALEAERDAAQADLAVLRDCGKACKKLSTSILKGDVLACELAGRVLIQHEKETGRVG